VERDSFSDSFSDGTTTTTTTTFQILWDASSLFCSLFFISVFSLCIEKRGIEDGDGGERNDNKRMDS